MFLTKEKLKNRLKEVHPNIYREKIPITGWLKKEDITKEMKLPPAVDDSWEPISTGDYWEGRDCYFWFYTELQVPNFSRSDQFALIFDFGNTGLANLGGFESLLFIDDSPYQGVDTYHQETFLDYEKHSGKKISLSFKAWSGLEGGGPKESQKHLFNSADCAYLDSPTKDFFYLSDNLLETIETLGDKSPEVPNYLRILNHAWNLVDLTEKGSEDFYRTINEANDYLQEKITTIPKQTPVTISAIGHTHIDVAWLWRLKHTREKAARSFSTVLKLMEEYPEYTFLQTQPQIYAYIKEDYPELYERIKQRVAEGRWEVDGAMWLESDCNIPSGESLVRQILLGKQFIKEEFGRESKYLWLPDVFGYSWALPQILKKSGIDTFMTTKISWSQYNQMPHDTFNWRGIDGTEILTHFITTPEPQRLGDPSFSVRYTYNGFLQPLVVNGTYENYHDKEVNQELLLAYGYGDGGGGVNRVMLENRRQMDKIASLPNVKMTRADDYFERLHQTVNETDSYVHTWDGELYLEYHRGTYTSEGRNKKYNRKLELLLRNTEIIHSLEKTNGKHYPKNELKEIWKILARNQFHDIIPGSSIEEVYQDSTIEYETALKNLTALVALPNEEDVNISFFNTTNWERSEWLKLPEKMKTAIVIDENEQPLKLLDLHDGRYVWLEKMAPLHRKNYQIQQSNQSDSLPVIQKMNQLETAIYIIEWNQEGHLTRIFDKKAQREVLAEGALGNQLQIFEDKPLEFDAWDIDLFYQQKMKVLSADTIRVLVNREEAIEVEFIYHFGKSIIKQVMRVFNDSRRIDFITTVDWEARQCLLKAAFPVSVRSTEATYDIQYGNVKRPTHWNTSWDQAKFETVGHQWADLSETNYGVSLLNDCKYGYDIKDNVLRLSLLKGAIFPNPVADIGHHEFTYSLYPHEGTVLESATILNAWQLNDPIMLLAETAEQSKPLFEFYGDSRFMIDAIKEAEDGSGIILRIHDYSGGRQQLEITPTFNFSAVFETNLMEEVEEPEVELSTVTLYPYEVKTLLFKN